MPGAVVVITGVMAAGKSTVAQRVGLAPRADVVAAREAARGKTGYSGGWTVPAMVAELGATPRIGLWLDNSDLTVEQTVDRILAYAREP
jgi:hypothetical protein